MTKPRLTTEQFIERSQKRWGARFGYRKAIYINNRTPLELFCLKHERYFFQTPKAHFIAKHECCPICYGEVAGSFQNEWREEVMLKINTIPSPEQDQRLKLVFRG